MTKSERFVPAPWRLTGSGFIFIFLFSRRFINAYSGIPHQADYSGGLGTVMLVDYGASPVGPYQEALFIPSLVHAAGHTHYQITRIAVSTHASVENGRENWGIPKVQADFTHWQEHGVQRFQMQMDGQTGIDAAIEIANRPRMKLDTRRLPYRPKIIQQRDRDRAWLRTAPYGKGIVQPARIRVANTDPELFPPFGAERPLFGVYASHFDLTFPAAEVIHAD